TDAKLLEEHAGKIRVVDITQGPGPQPDTSGTLKQLGKAVKVDASDSCFVMMPFAPPIGGYYGSIYEPAIKRAGLTPVRADAEIFGTGKIMDQVWTGMNSARVL